MLNQTSFILENIKIEVTHKCQLACVHCSNDGSPSNNNTLSEEKCIKIINEASSIGVRKVAFSGGEPLIWPSLIIAVETASKKGMEVIIFTSGYATDSEKILLELYNAGLNKAIFSVYSSDKLQHDRITRKNGSFIKTQDALIFAHEIGLDTELHFVAMANNYTQLDEVVKFAKNIGVSVVSVLRFAPQGRGSLLKKSVLNKKQNIDLQKRIFELRKAKYVIRTGTPYNFLLVNENHQCESGINKLTINPDLRIFPCDGFKNIMAEEFVGSLKLSTLENESLIDCWRNSPYLLRLRQYLTSDFEKPCKVCKVLNKCMSGCTAQKVLKFGDLVKGVDPDCLME